MRSRFASLKPNDFTRRSVASGLGFLAVALASLFLIPASTGAQTQTAAPAKDSSQSESKSPAGFKLEPCPIAALNAEGQCGKLDVFENRESKSGRKISLNILVLPASGASKQPDPVFFLVGGPGAGSVATAKLGVQKELIEKFRRSRDVVFVDQRGTGESNPLKCDFLGDSKNMQPLFDPPMSPDKVRECRTQLEKTADLKLYTTSIAMDDLDDVRAALGYSKVNLYGGSYGSTAALVYLRRHGDHVRAVGIEGVAPPDYRLPLPIAKGVQHSMEELFHDCAADERCQEAFPNLKTEFESVLSALDKEPATVKTGNMLTRQLQTITLSRNAYVDSVRLLLYFPQFRSLLPYLIHQNAEGDFSAFAAIAFSTGYQVGSRMDRGMSLSVICSEDVPFFSSADIIRETSGTYFGDSLARAYTEACKQWPRGAVPPDFATPVKSDVPVLMLSGEVDPVTPPWIGGAAVRSLSGGRQLVAKNWTHSSTSDCATGLMSDFIDKGSAKGLDTVCYEAGPPPVFGVRVNAPEHKDQPGETLSDYEGTIDFGSLKLRVVLHVHRSAEGKYFATLDSPDQSTQNIWIDGFTQKGGTMHFEIALSFASFDGKVESDGATVNGTWTQDGRSHPLALKRK